ncbi:DUF6625 family protein [Sphingobacterium sp. GVS05A]|uniref:DUF6625 family protein n=1 Tax=Sphingobacterium TaxID=28453 RepID=UPI001CC0D4B4|nr:DUF6625 family protein [Sphingobacterium sp. GVS05A]
MHKVVLINVFIGQFPWYFSYFIHSCRYNNEIDFLIYTDNSSSNTDLPTNVTLIKFTIEEFNENISRVLNTTVNIKNGYKLCDFKPTYGAVFYDDIKDYDFWGYCDLDIIWGNIRAFMTSQLLDTYDVISARHDYLTGCFTLYRNNELCRHLFRKSKDYLKVLTSDKNFCFDETNFAFEEFEQGVNYRFIKSEIESMTHVVRRLHEEGYIRAYFEFQIIEGITGDIIWDTGTLIFRNEFEVLLYHLVRFKEVFLEDSNKFKTLKSKLMIEKDGIHLA